MRITFVIDSLGSGGAQRQLVELAICLKVSGAAEPTVVQYYADDFFAGRLEDAGVPRIVVPRSKSLDIAFPLRLRRAIVRSRPDVVHAFLLTPAFWAWLALRGETGVTFVAAERNSRIATSMTETLLQRWVYRHANAVTVNAEPVAEAIASRLAVPADRIHYLPNGIDVERWDASSQDPLPFDVSGDGVHLAMIGGLRPQKNHGLLLRALTRLDAATREKLSVWCVGDHTSGDAYARGIHDLAASLELGDTVRFRPATQALAPLLGRMDGLVLSSAWEGFPNVVLEAMTSSLPVIATRVGNVGALVLPGETGWLVEPEAEEEMAAAIKGLVGLRPERRREMGAVARAFVEERFSLAAVTAAHADFYAQVHA